MKLERGERDPAVTTGRRIPPPVSEMPRARAAANPRVATLHGSAALRSCLLAAALFSGCDEKKPTPAPSRVVAVQAAQEQSDPASFCDARYEGESAPVFTLPPVAGRAADLRSAESSDRPRWVNIWATWCPPCTEELPLLSRLSEELAGAGVEATLVLVSVDASAEAVSEFVRSHPEAAGTLRLDQPEALAPWLKSIGLDRATTLPVHVFVNGQGRVVCTRNGAVSESDAPSIRRLLAERPP